MAVQLSCDVCGNNIEKSDNGTIFEWGNAKVRVMTAIDNVWNGGHICLSCIMNTVLNGGVEEPNPATRFNAGYRDVKDGE